MRLRDFVDRVLCRLLGRHAWCTVPGAQVRGWFCMWCGAERDLAEVEQ